MSEKTGLAVSLICFGLLLVLLSAIFGQQAVISENIGSETGAPNDNWSDKLTVLWKLITFKVNAGYEIFSFMFDALIAALVLWLVILIARGN